MICFFSDRPKAQLYTVTRTQRQRTLRRQRKPLLTLFRIRRRLQPILALLAMQYEQWSQVCFPLCPLFMTHKACKATSSRKISASHTQCAATGVWIQFPLCPCICGPHCPYKDFLEQIYSASHSQCAVTGVRIPFPLCPCIWDPHRPQKVFLEQMYPWAYVFPLHTHYAQSQGFEFNSHSVPVFETHTAYKKSSLSKCIPLHTHNAKPQGL